MKTAVTSWKHARTISTLIIAMGLSLSLKAHAGEVSPKVRNYVLKTCDQLQTETLEKKAAEYAGIIQSAAEEYKVNPNLIKAVITAETCFRPNAVSPKGAAGLMQLMPATAKRFGARDSSLKTNVHTGTRYLRWLLDRYDGSVKHAVAAYNSGEGTVDRHGLAVPYRETQQYLVRVMNAYSKLSANDERKVRSVQRSRPIVRRTVTHGNRFSERRLTGQFQSRRALPSCMTASRSLHRATTHVDRKGERAFYYKVRRNDSLGKIGQKVGTSVVTLRRYNDISGSRIVPGQRLKVAECRL